MTSPELDRCLVVGAEEADWLLCDAYRKWRLLRPAPPVEPFALRPRGMILSEGAGAVVLAREGTLELERIHPGGNFTRQRELVRQLDAICGQLRESGEADVLIASANGTFIDEAERAAAAQTFCCGSRLHAKAGTGRKRRGGRLLATDLRRASAAQTAVAADPSCARAPPPNDCAPPRSDAMATRDRHQLRAQPAGRRFRPAFVAADRADAADGEPDFLSGSCDACSRLPQNEMSNTCSTPPRRIEKGRRRRQRRHGGFSLCNRFTAPLLSASAMRKPVFFFLFLLTASCALAVEQLQGPGSLPIEINATGRTTYENGLATAHDNVAIHFGDTDIYSDFAQYDTAKRTLLLRGHVRIYRDITLYIGNEATYNVDTKAIKADDMRTGTYPYLLSGQTVTSASDAEYDVKHGTFTTHDAAQPDFHLNAQTVRIYPDDHVILKDVTLYIGKVPVFWWPYLYQSLDRSFSYLISPAYLSSWGPSLLGQVTFPIGEKITATLRLDYRSRRGEAIGLDADMHYGKGDKSDAKIVSYFLQDQNPNLNRTSLPRQGTPTSRYRFTLEDHTQITDDIRATVNITKLSDAFVLQDFYPAEFRINPQPDNVVAVTKTSPFYTLTAYSRFQLNTFFETTERLPEIALDITRHGLFGGPIFYEGDTSLGELRLNNPANSIFQDYSAFRFDTFHQLTYPNTYFGFLSIVPRVGFRETYYGETQQLNPLLPPVVPGPNPPEFPLPPPETGLPSPQLGPVWRSIFNAGIEGSFKVSREWDDVQTRALGLDGLRHIFQPYVNFSYVSEPNIDPATILQFDRVQPTTKLNAIDFPNSPRLTRSITGRSRVSACATACKPGATISP